MNLTVHLITPREETAHWRYRSTTIMAALSQSSSDPSRRWSIIGLAIVGWAAAMGIVAVTTDARLGLADGLSRLGTVVLCSIVVVLAAAVSIPLCRDRSWAFLHGGHLWRHPPLWSAVVLALALHSIVYSYTGVPEGVSDHRASELGQLWTLVGLIIAGAFVAWAIEHVRTVRSPPSPAPGPGIESLEALEGNPALIEQWLDSDDRPIASPDQDFLRHAPIARRIAGRLQALRETTILLRGARGAGKTSICHLTEHYLSDRTDLEVKPGPTIKLHRLSAWEFDDTRSLLRGILSAIVQQTHLVADTYSLIGLPATYLSAVSSAGGWIAGAASLLAPSGEPHEALRRVSRILIAVDVRVVIWLDDLERFREGRDRSDEPVKALLALMRDCPNISFVLAEGWAGTSASDFDFPKLGSFTELLPRPDPLQVARIVRAFKGSQLKRFLDIDPDRRETTEPFGSVGRVEEIISHDPDMITSWGAVGRVLDTPRKLKSVLRRVREAWAVLHGEVRFDDLLVTLILRESDLRLSVGKDGGRYAVLDLIDDNIPWLRARFAGGKTEEPSKETTPAQQALGELSESRRIPEGVLTRQLFGRGNENTRPQSVASGGPSDYWARIRAEGINESVRDQTILAAIEEFRSGGDTVPRPGADHRLVEWVMNDGAEADKVRQFARRLRPEPLLRLAQLVLDRLVAAPRAAPMDDRRYPQALLNLGLLFHDNFVRPERRLELARNAIARVMADDLLMAHEIEKSLVRRPSTFESSPDSQEDRAAIARHTFDVFMHTFGNPGGGRKLIRAMRAGQPFLLSWLLNRGDPSQVHVADWAHVASVLVDAAELSPELAGQALAAVLADGEMSHERPEMDEDSGELRSRHRWQAKFNEERAGALLGQDFGRAMGALARVPTEALSDEATAHIGAVVEFARTWMKQNGDGGP